MKKFFISVLLILMLPIIIFAVLYVYVQYVLPFQREIQFYANRNRSCEEPADPVRIRINSKEFTIPADYFDNQSLSWCWGFYTGYCTDSQSRKNFHESNAGKETTGFCQKDSDSPFVLKGINLFFERYTKNALKIKLSAVGLPVRNYELKNISLMHMQRWSISDYCKKANDSSPKIFGNPIIFDCYESVGDGLLENKRCTIKGIVDDDVYFFQTGSFSIDELPVEYWESYVKEIEDMINGIILEEPKSSYPQICTDIVKEN